MDCYCGERRTNPELAESMKDLPEGYCGLCDVCGLPGHMRAHPFLPTTGAWCDEHWKALIARPPMTPDRIFLFLVMGIVGISIGISVFRMLF